MHGTEAGAPFQARNVRAATARASFEKVYLHGAEARAALEARHLPGAIARAAFVNMRFLSVPGGAGPEPKYFGEPGVSSEALFEPDFRRKNCVFASVAYNFAKNASGGPPRRSGSYGSSVFQKHRLHGSITMKKVVGTNRGLAGSVLGSRFMKENGAPA